MEKELLSNVLQISGQLKVLHWQTTSYAEHNAFERIYDSLGDLADYDSIKVDAFISAAEEFFVDAFMAEQDSELSNIKDEIVAELQQLKYLLTLK